MEDIKELTASKLLALACVAFHAGKYDEAGSLFAQSMRSESADEAVCALLEATDIDVAITEIQQLVSTSASFQSLSAVVEELSNAMESSDCIPVSVESDCDMDPDELTDFNRPVVIEQPEEVEVEPSDQVLLDELETAETEPVTQDQPIVLPEIVNDLPVEDEVEPETTEDVENEETVTTDQVAVMAVASVLKFKNLG
jgi:hypothetical protein